MFEKETIISALLYILQQLGGRCNMHKICKILYFADREHLKLYGRTIIADEYIAMKYGPVPSQTYDILKAVRGDSYFSDTPSSEQLCELFACDGIEVSAKQSPNMDYLSESDIECLNYAINKCKDLSFQALTELSHGYAWTHATPNDTISPTDMLKEINAPQEYVDYIGEQIQLDKAVKSHFN